MASTNSGYILPRWIPALMRPTFKAMLDKSEQLQNYPEGLDADSVEREDVKVELLIKHYLEQLSLARGEEREVYGERIFSKLIDTLRQDAVVGEAHLNDGEWGQFRDVLHQQLKGIPITDRISITTFRRAVWSYRMGVVLDMSTDEIRQAITIILGDEHAG